MPRIRWTPRSAAAVTSWRFKATALRDLHTNEQNRTNTQKVLRAIAGFANANGGTLLIGVEDDGTVVGVNEDYEFVSRGNRDGFELLLRSLVHDRISKLAATLFDISFDCIDGKDICRIDGALPRARCSADRPRTRISSISGSGWVARPAH